MIRLLPVLALVAGLFAALPLTAQQPRLPGQTAAPAETAAPETAAPLDDLIRALRDDATREALIAELERAAATAGGEGEPVAEEAAPPPSIGGQIARVTQRAAENTADALSQVWTSARSARTLMRGLNGDTWRAIWDGLLQIALVAVVTFALFVALRRLTLPLLRHLGRTARAGSVVRAVLAFAGSVVVRAAPVVIAWAIGYGVMTVFVGDFGQIGLGQTLFLNAFLVVELIKAAVRTVLSPAADDLRALSMTDRAARRTSNIASVAISILGYGILLVVPIVGDTVSFMARRSLSVLAVELTVLYLAVAALWHARDVGDWLVRNMLARPAPPDDGAEVSEVPREGFFVSILRNWHWFALIYLAFIAIRAFTNSLADVGATVLGTLEIAAVAFVGTAAIGFLGKRMRAGVILTDDVRARLPLLEARLNSVVPKVLMALRALVALIVVVFALNQIGLIGFGAWIDGEAGRRFTSGLVAVAVILVVAWAIWLAVSSWVDYRLNPDFGEIPTSRETTLLTLLKNAVTVAILIFAVMFSLSEIGLNIGPLIASAGVLGLAIGFGAQKLVQDIITGIFIQFENAINVGDVVTVGGTTGGVERLTVRSVTLRDLQGIVHIIPFSSVDMVSNFTREFSFYVLDMGIAYRENVDEAKEALFDAYDELRGDPEQGAFLLGDLEYFGLDAFGDSSIVLKVRIKTWPGKQWGVGRAYNRLVKKVFDERGIEIPYPHTTLLFGESKEGATQPIRIEPLPAHDGGKTGDTADPSRGKPSDDGPLADGDD